MSLKPPVAERIDHRETRHGRQVVDPYHWLRDDQRRDPVVRAYLEAENAFTEAVMAPTGPLRKQLYEEMLGRIKQTDQSVPVRKDGYYYYSRSIEGRQYRVYCRRKGSLDAPEEVLLDENELARGQEYFRLGVFEVSPDHRTLAFSSDTDGSERYTLYFKNLASGELLPDRIPGTSYAVEWANDGRTVFYNTLDAKHRPYRLLRHGLGEVPEDDVLVYQEDDEAFFLSIYKTKNLRFLMLQLGSSVTSEVRCLDADRPTGEFRTIQPRQQKVEYWVEHWRDRFYILTNDDAIDFKLVEVPEGDPQKAAWKTVIPHRPGVKLDAIDVFEDHLVVVDRVDALRGIRVIRLPEWTEHRVDFPEPVYTVGLRGNPEFRVSTLRFVYESMVTPESTFDYDMDRRERVLRKRQVVLGGYESEHYACERTFAEAPDGRRVPISLVYRKNRRGGEPGPLLLYGYGAYGHTIEPGFVSTRVSLLDRGMIYAIAHVRGGGTCGRSWYDDGKLLRKQNTFTDFIASAEHLIARGYTSSDHIAIHGGSAGGLLVGGVLNRRPDLFAVAVADVPFVDVLNTMSDPTIPLTVIEWDEWGNPHQREFHDYIAAYSPYDNVEVKDYPHLLVTAGLNDPRVGYWEPAKWVAKLRALKVGDRDLLLKTNLDAGHGGASGRYDRLRELAFEYGFVLTRLGLDGTPDV